MIDTIQIGDVYIEINPPRREWRIIEERGSEHFTLERVDKPRVLRFLDSAALRDPHRYLRRE